MRGCSTSDYTEESSQGGIVAVSSMVGPKLKLFISIQLIYSLKLTFFVSSAQNYGDPIYFSAEQYILTKDRLVFHLLAFIDLRKGHPPAYEDPPLYSVCNDAIVVDSTYHFKESDPQSHHGEEHVGLTIFRCLYIN